MEAPNLSIQHFDLGEWPLKSLVQKRFVTVIQPSLEMTKWEMNYVWEKNYIINRNESCFNESLGYLGEFKSVIILMYYICMALRSIFKNKIGLEFKTQ